MIQGNSIGGMMHPKIQLAYLECRFLEGFLKENEVCEQIQHLLLNDEFHHLRLPEEQVNDLLRGKMFLKMGNWMRQKADDLQPKSLEAINKMYKESLKFFPRNHKTWHAYAMLNYDFVMYYSDGT